ncbi:PepSY domain-containing protein [Catenovulum sp. 2E275]|uniref:PepSY-associated TM helix domain-containing protein n=1 Tax=Catenovulum sp. 2E275 TaxID=2980497 RepID=UPI0021CF65C4|nr:PepSY domain-containing protein [Catenovulum sp. 2E275]MCU4676535.1 PepSY domain-containing protein [Catenovulum sp. 2E275]
MKGSLRQSMTWLHTWSTIIAGWILFAIFLTGTLSFFRIEINHWMEPELHQSAPDENSVYVAYDYLKANAPQATSWQISLPDERERAISLSWQQPVVVSEQAQQNNRQRRGQNAERQSVVRDSGGENAQGQAGNRQSRMQNGEQQAGNANRSNRQNADNSARTERQNGQQNRQASQNAQPQNQQGEQRGGNGRMRKLIDAQTGEEITPRETAGGNFLYRFHFMFYGMDRDLAYILVGIVSMMMLVGIISGIIMHRKIFTDFFAFRPKKKLLTWIDGHAITAVLALPFHIMITFSGLLLIAGAFLPWNGEPRHRGDRNGGEAPQVQYVEKDFSQTPPFEKMFLYAEQKWGTEVTSISISEPGTDKAEYALRGNNRVTLSSGRSGSETITFDNTFIETGEPVKTEPGREAENTAQAIYNYFDMLHQARFADTVTRWLLFIAGIMGTIMVGTGSILWAVKRSKKQSGQFGFELVKGSNIGTIAGLLVACGAYFWANRLIPAQMAERDHLEISVFFGVWAVCIVAGLLWRNNKNWLVQLSITGVLFTLIPVLDSLTSPVGLIYALQTGDWLRLGFNLCCLLIATTVWAAVYYIALVKPKRTPKTDKSEPQSKTTAKSDNASKAALIARKAKEARAAQANRTQAKQEQAENSTTVSASSTATKPTSDEKLSKAALIARKAKAAREAQKAQQTTQEHLSSEQDNELNNAGGKA